MTKRLFMQIKPPVLHAPSLSLSDTISIENIFSASPHSETIDASFNIHIPKELLSDKWGMVFTPTVVDDTTVIVLKDIEIKGTLFSDMQDRDYEKYNEFINSIIDTSLYEKLYIDQKRLEYEIEHRHDMYWQYYYDEWERQIEFEKWKATQDGSITTFYPQNKETYKEILYEQYMIRIDNQSKRYLKAGMDTTGLHTKYMDEFVKHNAKMPRFIVNNNLRVNKVPRKFKDIYESKRTLNDITKSMLLLLIERDSALLSIPVLDYQKIIENEQRTLMQDKVFENIIQFPRSLNSRLDTIVTDTNNDFVYTYKYMHPIDKNKKQRIKISLKGKITAIDKSGFTIAPEKSLTYIVLQYGDTVSYIPPVLTVSDTTLVTLDSVAIDSLPAHKPSDVDAMTTLQRLLNTKMNKNDLPPNATDSTSSKTILPLVRQFQLEDNKPKTTKRRRK